MKTESTANLSQRKRSNQDIEDTEKGLDQYNICQADEYILTETEKRFILAAEKGDCAGVKRIIDEYRDNPAEFNIDCVDPLNRSALISAIENENEDLISLLLKEGIAVKDALLHAISEEYVEAVEELLEWEEQNHEEDTPYSWEAVDRSKSNFTPDITPLILAAHRNNYEILKILLDRGASLPMPHDVKCGCDVCLASQTSDSLRHSQARINAYRALSASSLIALSSRDPILKAFELSYELKHLQVVESEFRKEYAEMREHVEEFVTTLLDHARTSTELEVMLNFNHESGGEVWMPGQRQTLERLKLAIKYKQKSFISHPNVQQLLAAIWYDGLPGFRRKTMSQQLLQVVKLGCSFPIYSMNYLLAPHSENGKFMKKPFVKFIMHSTSYMFFLMLLGASSLRIVPTMFEVLAFPWMLEMLDDWKKHERGSLPGPIELGIIMYITSLIFGELKTLYEEGLLEYICDLWNIVDFVSNAFYVTWILMRVTSWIISHRDLWYHNINPYFPREHWHPFDPMLIAEGAFAAGMIFSFLKLVHIFSINPHLGPLQVSLGRMIIDIIKFFFIYTLVLFAYGCGLNQLLWYYADMEKHKCYHLHPDVADFDDQEKSCTIWRRFANLFETSQSLFWASFGLVDLVSFDLAGVKGFTRFWALLLFGSYSVINIIVLLNMLIAMMSNSYQVIYEKSDVEWKFARSQLWMSYFDDGGTLPPPFNMCPSFKLIRKTLGRDRKRTKSILRRALDKAQALHDKVMRLLVRRYVTSEQRKRDDFGITEDDIIEVRADISSFRFEILDVLNKNDFKVPDVERKTEGGTKKGKVLERRIKKDFQIGLVESISNEIKKEGGTTKDIFSTIAKAIGKRGGSIKEKNKDWNAIVRKNTVSTNPIGSTKSSMIRRSQRSLRRKMIEEANAGLDMDTDVLVELNPRLGGVTPTTRVAYVKFMQKTLTRREQMEENKSKEEGETNKSEDGTNPVTPNIRPELSKALSISSIKKGVLKQDSVTSSKLTAQKSAAPLPPEAPTSTSSAEDGTISNAKEDSTITDKGKARSAPSKQGDNSNNNSNNNKPSVVPKPSDKPAGKPGDKPSDSGGNDKKDESERSSADKKSAAPSKPDNNSGTSSREVGKSSTATSTTTTSEAGKSSTATTNDTTSTSTAPSKPTNNSGTTSSEAGKSSTATSTTTSSEAGKSSTATAPSDNKKIEADKPVVKKPPPKPVNIGDSSAAAGASGDRGKSTVTGRMISGWL